MTKSITFDANAWRKNDSLRNDIAMYVIIEVPNNKYWLKLFSKEVSS
ncbi:MAG: hypothetical protein IMY73_02890 [Bacteroidetes bacterium]|nr:hypothetical protein [Bacteroidota bacterium]